MPALVAALLGLVSVVATPYTVVLREANPVGLVVNAGNREFMGQPGNRYAALALELAVIP